MNDEQTIGQLFVSLNDFTMLVSLDCGQLYVNAARENYQPIRPAGDKSVVKWFVSEDYSEEARLLLAHRIERHAPDILLAEFANTVWKKAQQNEITEPRVYFDEHSHLRKMIGLHACADHIERAGQIALEIDHPVYDCLYLACAEATDSMLITADR